MLEYFVHLDADDAPPDLVLVTAEVPADVSQQRLSESDLSSRWRESPAPAELAGFGDEFVEKAARCVLIVPSALAPHENNWLLNPQHPDFRRITISRVEGLRYDPRMFSARRRKPRKK